MQSIPASKLSMVLYRGPLLYPSDGSRKIKKEQKHFPSYSGFAYSYSSYRFEFIALPWECSLFTCSLFPFTCSFCSSECRPKVSVCYRFICFQPVLYCVCFTLLPICGPPQVTKRPLTSFSWFLSASLAVRSGSVLSILICCSTGFAFVLASVVFLSMFKLVYSFLC